MLELNRKGSFQWPAIIRLEIEEISPGSVPSPMPPSEASEKATVEASIPFPRTTLFLERLL
jgi:hypothetical protein